MDDMRYENGGRAIRERREAMGLSTTEVSARCGLTAEQFSAIEGDHIGVDYSQFERIADAFGLHVLELSWEYLIAAKPGFQQTLEGRKMQELTKSILGELRSAPHVSSTGSDGNLNLDQRGHEVSV